MNKLSLCTRGLLETHPKILENPFYSSFPRFQETEVETYDFPDQIKLRDDKPASSSDGCSR
uniref:Uncharacterized protein n=1 Tax=Anguilla anguilla TaxID=7936 RepID=A0A0E9PFP9_ANGAN